MSLRITHANPKGPELGTSEQQIVLAKDGVGAKKPTDFRPAVSTFKIKLSCSAPSLSLSGGVCQVPVCFSRHSMLEQRGDMGTKVGGPLSQLLLTCFSLWSTSHNMYALYVWDAEPMSLSELTGKREGRRARMCVQMFRLMAGRHCVKSAYPALQPYPVFPQPSSLTIF